MGRNTKYWFFSANHVTPFQHREVSRAEAVALLKLEHITEPGGFTCRVYKFAHMPYFLQVTHSPEVKS